MRIIICGAGQVGYGIAERLAAENNDITLIDTDSARIRLVDSMLDVRTIVGHGAHPDVLAAAGAQGADMLIAVTLHDEVNMIACHVAHDLFSIPVKIARIRASSYLDKQYGALFSSERMPIDVVISPEVEVGEMVLRRIREPGTAEVFSLADGEVVVLGIVCAADCPLLGVVLRQLTGLFPDLPSTVIGVKRAGKPLILHAHDALIADDTAYVVCARDAARRTLGLFGHEERQARRITIVGGGGIGFYVARALEAHPYRYKVKIIEANAARAAFLADALHKTTIICGSALERAVLQESGVERADLLIALTNQDQVNVLCAMMARRLGVCANMVLINDPAFEEFTRSDGIDAPINPRSVTVSKVLQHIRRGRILGVQTIASGQAEIIEAEAMKTSPLVGQQLDALDLPDGVRIGAVLRQGSLIRPTATTRIQAHDRVVIFAYSQAVRDVEHMFRVSLDFF